MLECRREIQKMEIEEEREKEKEKEKIKRLCVFEREKKREIDRERERERERELSSISSYFPENSYESYAPMLTSPRSHRRYPPFCHVSTP